MKRFRVFEPPGTAESLFDSPSAEDRRGNFRTCEAPNAVDAGDIGEDWQRGRGGKDPAEPTRPACQTGSGASEKALFVRDGFSLVAFLIPALWLLWHRLFLAAIAVFALDVLIGWQAGTKGFGLAAAALPLLIGLLVALEGPSLKAWKLRRQGWRETAALIASDRAEAEIRYYAGMAAGGWGEIRTHDTSPAAPLNSDASRSLGPAPSPLSD